MPTLHSRFTWYTPLTARRVLSIVALAVLVAPPLEAQPVRVSTPDSTRAPTASRAAAEGRPEFRIAPPPPLRVVRSQQADTLLPVVDEFGVLIPEESITEAMRRAKGRQVIAGVAGLVVGGLLGAAMGFGECGVLDSCSDREQFHASAGVWFGAAIGAVLGAGVIAPGADRWRAVEEIRRERRAGRSER